MRFRRCGWAGSLVGNVATIAIIVFVALTAACQGPPSNTGFVGSWSRGDRAPVVSIWRDGDAWRFCWSGEIDSGGPKYRCGMQGGVEMQEDGRTTYAYETSVVEDPEGAGLIVTIVGTPVLPELTPIRWVDRLELAPGGLEFLGYQIELNGVPRVPPVGPLRYAKLSDDPR